VLVRAAGGARGREDALHRRLELRPGRPGRVDRNGRRAARREPVPDVGRLARRPEIAHCKQHNVTYEAYSPLRRVDLEDHRIAAIATAHGVTTAQVALKWIYQQGVAIATSPGTNGAFIRADLALDTFDLADDEMAKLSAM